MSKEEVMNKDIIFEICKRLNNENNKETLEEICREKHILPCFFKRMCKDFGIIKSNILNIYYEEKFKDEIKAAEDEAKTMEVLNTIQNLWLKRYRGINEEYEQVLDEGEEIWDEPRETIEINLNCELLDEINELSIENNVEISFYIEKMLLQMLERNKETRGKKVIKKYIKTMLSGTDLEEHEEEVIENIIKNKKFMKFGKITYRDKVGDLDTYRINYLLNNGYMLNEINEIKEADEEYQGEALENHYYLIHSGECKSYKEALKTISEWRK